MLLNIVSQICPQVRFVTVGVHFLSTIEMERTTNGAFFNFFITK